MYIFNIYTRSPKLLNNNNCKLQTEIHDTFNISRRKTEQKSNLIFYLGKLR